MDTISMTKTLGHLMTGAFGLSCATRVAPAVAHVIDRGEFQPRWLRTFPGVYARRSASRRFLDPQI